MKNKPYSRHNLPKRRLT